MEENILHVHVDFVQTLHGNMKHHETIYRFTDWSSPQTYT